MRTTIIHVDGLEGGWERLGAAQAGWVDEACDDDDVDDGPLTPIEAGMAGWMEEERERGEQLEHIRARCPARLRHGLDAIIGALDMEDAAGRLGRSGKRIEQLLTEIIDAVRSGEPVQTELFPGGGDGGPLPPTRRGRPRGSRTRRETDADGQGGLL